MSVPSLRGPFGAVSSSIFEQPIPPTATTNFSDAAMEEAREIVSEVIAVVPFDNAWAQLSSEEKDSLIEKAQDYKAKITSLEGGEATLIRLREYFRSVNNPNNPAEAEMLTNNITVISQALDTLAVEAGDVLFELTSFVNTRGFAMNNSAALITNILERAPQENMRLSL